MLSPSWNRDFPWQAVLILEEAADNSLLAPAETFKERKENSRGKKLKALR
jgi:hypothetical protein